MINEIKCSICGKRRASISCGKKTKTKLKKYEERLSDYICVQCKRKGTGEYRNSYTNHQQHNVYFNEDMED